MEAMILPPYLDVFVAIVRDNTIAQTATIAVLALIICDWVFGIGAAIARHEFDSAVMREGLWHKCAELGLLFVGIIVDGALLGGFDLGYTAPMYTALCAYICIMELGSLLEIFAKMNPQLGDSGPLKLLAATTEDKAGAHAREDE